MRTKTDNLGLALNRPIIPKEKRVGATLMAANQVVLYFEKPEDALLFTLAASSVMSAEGPGHSSTAAIRVVQEICKASRITTEGALNVT
jgi:hypothetical protein